MSLIKCASIICYLICHSLSGVREFCETETFQAQCQPDEVISMTVAKYGRMKIGRCVRKDLGYLGCFSDVLPIADRKCSGKQTCEIRMPDADFDQTKPCLEELKTYMEARYDCIKGLSQPDTQLAIQKLI